MRELSGVLNRREPSAPQHVLDAEAQLLQEAYGTLFGDWIVQVGAWGRGTKLLDGSRVRQRALITSGGGKPSATSEYHALALASDSVDVVVLAHTLEYSAHSDRVLSEAERVLVGEGRLLILGSNRWSPWQLSRLWSRHVPAASAHRLIGKGRLKHRLRRHGMEIDYCRRYDYGIRSDLLWWQRVLALLRSIAQVGVPGLAAGYFVVARKRVTPFTPIKPTRRQRKQSLVADLVRPTARSTSQWRK